MIQIDQHVYFHEDQPCHGWIAYNDQIEAMRPAILIAPTFRGLDEVTKARARELAQLGYIALAVDVYGDGKVTEDPDEASEWMAPFFINRKLLQERMIAAAEAIRGHPKTEQGKVGAIGFCFGGLAVYELLRSGNGISGAVSFHGVLACELRGEKAKTVPINSTIEGSLLVLNGYEDPLVTPKDLDQVAKEMTAAGVDWQIYNYGHTCHAFTTPGAADPKGGFQFSEKSARRAFRSMQTFFSELFGEI